MVKSLRSQGGFTLIELVLVVVVLGIIATVAVIRFSNITRDAKDAALRGLAGAYGGQLAVAISRIGARPTGGATLGNCLPAPGTSNRFIDCVYGLVPNPTATRITRSTYNAGANRFNICTDTNAIACTNALIAGGCGSTTQRFVRVTYTPATGALTIFPPANCAS
jgi:prepilin-type N-terminal cleavage/methylation domain-containing protein